MNGWRVIEADCVEAMAAMPDASVDAICTDPPYGIGFMGHEWDQPGEFGPVAANGEPAEMQSGRRRRSQPTPESGAGHARDRKPFNGHGPREGMRVQPGVDHTQTRIRGGAMHAGRYDLSRTANQRFQAWCEAWGSEALRVLKPGGHLLVFGGTRTYHRLTSGLEGGQNQGRRSPEDLAWKRAVLEAGGYRCALCGSDRRLEGHHVRALKDFPELRHDVANGLCVCHDCHYYGIHGGQPNRIHGRYARSA